MTANRVGEPVVSARDLSIHYVSRDALSYHKAISGVSFDLAPGEVLGVVGESGSGKSTLALTIAAQAGRGTAGSGTAEICGGSLRVGNTDIRRLTRRRRDRLTLSTGYLSQGAAVSLNPQLTVSENVAEPIFLRDRRFNQREAMTAVATLIDSVQLPLSVLDSLPHELSSGQRQRVALARALILEPTLLVADEPTRGIDATVRSGVIDVLRELQRERGFSALIVSSDLDVISTVADRVAVLDRGLLIGIGPIDTVFTDPQHPYLRSLAAVHDQRRRQSGAA
ncbi:ATP-binding cassette domain-containing protein [Salinibacterium hongtaonis]|uniref:ABC transporter ATP-binding protein n=1 Tax=Homoserinimonas hongtaonis TaxID=2079791 RepID=A0A2U1SYX7_9MICO|nr:dipeptide/oligopeptide/nickel ABC transporter ATP-binding protein [Salinibacterium hongtaonis]AWB89379.1 ABC transporter ATP-binding protein [Salinibacterium hongtaonis]PWB96827.1 ABC transporter ATP-binding protein [Salinibacterium hongtaonis]